VENCWEQEVKDTMKPSMIVLLGAALWLGMSVIGCRKPVAPPAQTVVPQPIRRPPPSAEELMKYHVNEGGLIPILEYHDVLPKENPRTFTRSITNFRHDLDRLYEEGYRPVLLHDYLDNRIDLPLGMSPVILTFDDARASQFHYLPDGSLDPDCALGILLAFQKAHPDFPVKATFYVLPKSAFGQPESAAKKMQALLAMGCEIGNHTVTHRSLRRMSDEEVQNELATCVALTQRLAPQAKIDTLALPMGIAPRNRKLLSSGEYRGQRYANRAVLLVGAGPTRAPISHLFNPLKIPRIQAQEGVSGSTFWLNHFKSHPKSRYVSDGDPNTTTIPMVLADKVDQGRLNGATLRTY
jgi:peptidoglycan/xylan/chitin deacetylase (PgdA/CDA1 family)